MRKTPINHQLDKQTKKESSSFCSAFFNHSLLSIQKLLNKMLLRTMDTLNIDDNVNVPVMTAVSGTLQNLFVN